MTGLVAYLALVVVVPALLLGHQGQDWPLKGAWRGVAGPLWARGRVEARMFTRARVRRSTGRVRLCSARVPRPGTGTGTTGPSRPRIRGWSASQGGRGAFPAPATPEPSRGRTELSITKEAA